MNLTEFKLKLNEIDKSIPKNKWIEIPVENKYWCFFEYQGLYAIYNKSKIIYIGVSSNINLRLKSHKDYNGKFKGKEKISKIKIKISSLSWRSLEYIEKCLILKLKPKYNKQIISKNTLKFYKVKEVREKEVKT